jgi:hypothetical protein
MGNRWRSRPSVEVFESRCLLSITIADMIFDDNAFADSIAPYGSSGVISGTDSKGDPEDPAKVLTGSDLSDNLIVPGSATITVSFTDNAPVNGPGADIALFDIGPEAGRSYGVLPKLSPYTSTQSPKIYSSVYSGKQTADGYNINVTKIDLSDFGIPDDHRIDSILIELGAPVPGTPPDLTAIGAINDATPLSIQGHGAYFLGTTQRVGFSYSAVGDVTALDVGLYKSSNSIFDSNAVKLSEQTGTTTGGAGSGAFELTEPLVGDPRYPWILVVYDNNKMYNSSSGDQTSDSTYLPTLTLTAPLIASGPNHFDNANLMDQTKFVIGDPSAYFTGSGSVTFEINYGTIDPFADTTYQTVGSERANPNITVTQRLAGFFVVQATAVFAGVTFISKSYFIEIQFPTAGQISADAGAKALFDGAWAQTIAYAEEHHGHESNGRYPHSKRHELGGYVVLDTATGSYSFDRLREGPNVGPTKSGSVKFGAAPADVFAADRRSARYVVAEFHTHTPTFYAISGHLAGPSDQDQKTATRSGFPGIVYDYVGSNGRVEARTRLDAPAKLYTYGPDRRPTPP